MHVYTHTDTSSQSFTPLCAGNSLRSVLFQSSWAGLVQDHARDNASDGMGQAGGRQVMELAWFIEQCRHRLIGHSAEAEDIAAQTSARDRCIRIFGVPFYGILTGSLFPSPWGCRCDLKSWKIKDSVAEHCPQIRLVWQRAPVYSEVKRWLLWKWPVSFPERKEVSSLKICLVCTKSWAAVHWSQSILN